MKKKIDTIWIEEIHESLESLQCISQRLYNLASAFYATGNQSMGRVLTNDSTIIDGNVRQIHGALGRMLSNDVQKGQKQIAEIFKTLAEGLEEKEKNINDKLAATGETEILIHGKRGSKVGP